MNGMNIGMTTTVTTPTTVTAILAIAASTSPISIPTATPSAWPAVPSAKPFAIGCFTLNVFKNNAPNAYTITALKITANDVIAGIPPILSEIGNAIAVVVACGSIEFITAVSKPIAFATMNTTITEQIDPTTIADKICH